MKISAVKLYENGFMTQPFAFGGETVDAEGWKLLGARK